MPKRDNHPFFCTKKECRKTAWDTPEYLTHEDWKLAQKILTAKSASEYAQILHEAFMNDTAEGYFYRVVGWPEGRHYCRDTTYIEHTAWPGFINHARPKLVEAVQLHFGLFASQEDMKDLNDIIARARMEIELWFPRQCQNPFTDFYWWYAETTPERNGGFLICAEPPANPDYKIAGKLEKHLTKEQNLQRFIDVARRLPILSYNP